MRSCSSSACAARSAISSARRYRESGEASSICLGIVNDILMFAKTETGRIPLQLEDTPIGPAIDAVVFLVGPMLAANDIKFSHEESDVDLSVIADRDRFNQILVNLLSNAAKFSPRGGAVTVCSESQDHLVAIHVADQGTRNSGRQARGDLRALCAAVEWTHTHGRGKRSWTRDQSRAGETDGRRRDSREHRW